jgi:hypothetical protein
MLLGHCEIILHKIRQEQGFFLKEFSTKKIRVFSPPANYTERPPLVGEVSANFSG